MDSFKHSFKSSDDINILIDVSNCGYQKCDSGYGLYNVVKGVYVIHHVVEGSGFYVVGDKTYKISKGETFIIFPNTVVSYYVDNKDPWEYYWVGFDGADVKNLISQTQFSKTSHIINTEKSNTLKELLLEIYNARGDSLYSHVKMTGYLFLLLSVLIEHGGKEALDVDISREYVKKALQFITENYHTHITINDIASHLGVSRSHMYRVFMRHLSESPKAYLERFRIRRSKTLLKQTNLTISQISGLVGYEDQLHFSKIFKKAVKISPKEYRKIKTHESKSSIN